MILHNLPTMTKMTTTITITWKAFGSPTSATIQYDTGLDEDAILAKAFRETNLYEGYLWNALEPHLPEDRTHTALSVGDEVAINGNVFRCEPFGWSTHSQI